MLFEGSRYTFCEGREDSAGRQFLTPRVPYRYRDLPDNVRHVARQGDTWWGLAARYFAGARRPAGYWWAIADFQPVPVTDPTVALVAGQVVVVPSLRTLREEILGEKRRTDHGV